MGWYAFNMLPAQSPQPVHADTMWHTLAVAEAIEQLQTDGVDGLSQKAAEQRLSMHGPNHLPEGVRLTPLRLLASQFSDFMILVLIAAAILAGALGDLVDTLVILAIVAINATIGFVQEYRAERAMAALRAMAAPLARVVRDGRIHLIPAAQLVPGDIVHLDAGNIIPADMRLIETGNLATLESALTGESATTSKSPVPLAGTDLPLGDRSNLVFKGTLVVRGRGRAVVTATGWQTELGRIAQLLRTTHRPLTPLQQRLARFGRVLSLLVLLLCAAIFAAGLWRGEPWLLMLLTAVSLAVAAIPEALPAVVSVALAFGARKMIRQQALIRKLSAVETLGAVTIICTDKTGTLTQNRMQVDALYADGGEHTPALEEPHHPVLAELLRAMALNNDSRPDDDGQLHGDPTETALYEAAEDAGLPPASLNAGLPRVAELSFEADRRCMTTVHRAPDSAVWLAYTKGSPEKVLAICNHVMAASGSTQIDRAGLLAVAQRMAGAGLRVLAFARRTFDAAPAVTPEIIETDLEFIGLAGLLDPPREEAAAAVAECRLAGIIPVMITGDHPETARAIATRLGIIDAEDEVITGQELDRLTDQDFAARIRYLRVYARTSPEQKLRIVMQWQAHGEFVAMTGDGVNDAPALQRANIGVAMGITGTDVAKEAAHLTLLDDNFSTIVRAVREGRRIYDNIRKFVKFAMTGNSGELWTLSLAPFFGMPLPLLPVHILWVNLLTDGLPGLALSREREEPNIMKRPPRPPAQGILADGLWWHILWVGLLLGAVALFTQYWALQHGIVHWQTMVFTVLTLSQLGHVLAIRSERESLWTRGFWSNRPLALAVILTLLLQLAVIYLPWCNAAFHTAPLSASELLFCSALSCVVFLAVEGEKWLLRRRRQAPDAIS